MYIRRIQLSNIRGFREVDLDLSRPDGSLAGWTVLAGRNGSGKSTLLQSIALATVGAEAARALRPSFAEWPRAGSLEAIATLDLQLSDDDVIPHQDLAQVARLIWTREDITTEPSVMGPPTALPATGPAQLGTSDFDVLVDYDRAESVWAEQLVQFLKNAGIRGHLVDWALRPGVDWRAAIDCVVEKAPAIVILFGANPDQRLTASQVKAALTRNRPVIPVILDTLKGEVSSSAKKAVLDSVTWVDFRKIPPEERLPSIIWGITGGNPHTGRTEPRIFLERANGTGRNWFLTAYGPYRRLSGHAVDAQRLMEGPGPIARVVSLFREDSSLVESVGWLREIYLQRLETKIGAAELERAVLALLNDGLLPDDVRVDQVDSDGLWVFQHDVRLPLRELSDGYRTVAALVMDIVRHLHRAFGELQIERAEDTEGAFWRVLHSGVVLVDEIDLHLHVSWQKRIGFWLKRHFPNIQFIVTTHSPFICQAADPGGLIRLPAPGEDRQVEKVSADLYNTVVHGSLDDAVLTELFGLESLYSPTTERLREAVAKLEAKAQSGNATAEELKELEALRSQLPRTMSSAVEQALRSLVES